MLCLICIVTILFSLWFCSAQTKAVKELLSYRERTIADALLMQSVQPETIANAINHNIDSGKGEEFLTKIGRTEELPYYFVPALQSFMVSAMLTLGMGLSIFLVLLLIVVFLFLENRERQYQNAEKIVQRFAYGDFSEHLPRVEEGTLARLYASIDDLASALQAKGEAEYKAKEFMKSTISDISHQLKTPLAALKMYQEIILEDAETKEVVIQFSHKIDGALHRMEGLIQTLLKITRLDAGGIVFEKEWVSITYVVQQAMSELLTRAAKEHKTMECSGAPDAAILCDLEWTREAIVNLIKNALDHTTEGNKVCITWECSAAATHITVSDNGSGINPEDIHHIFKRFYRSQNSLKHQGVGLGLPLAKSIVEGQGGILSVQSMPNEGASFTITFLSEV